MEAVGTTGGGGLGMGGKGGVEAVGRGDGGGGRSEGQRWSSGGCQQRGRWGTGDGEQRWRLWVVGEWGWGGRGGVEAVSARDGGGVGMGRQRRRAEPQRWSHGGRRRWGSGEADVKGGPTKVEVMCWGSGDWGGRGDGQR